MEEELQEDLEKYMKNGIPGIERYESEHKIEDEHSKHQMNSLNLPGEENGSPGRQEEKEKFKASYDVKVQALKEQQKVRLRELEEENEKKLKRETKEMAEHIKMSLLKHRESLGEQNSLHKLALESRRRLDASKNLLNYLCSLEDRELKSLAHKTGKRGYPYRKGMCFGTEGAVSKLPLDYNNSKYFQVALFEGHTISKRLTSYVFNHIVDKSSGHHHLSSRFNEQQFNLPKTIEKSIPSIAFRDAAVLIHPWLGVFYKVRVPLILSDSNNDKSTESISGRKNAGSDSKNTGDGIKPRKNVYAYRKECYRRPWSNFNAKDVDNTVDFKKAFDRFKTVFKKHAAKFVRKYITHENDGPSEEGEKLDDGGDTGSNTGEKKEAVSIVLMLHSSVRTNSIARLYKQISSSEFKRKIYPLTIRLILVLCPFDKCKSKTEILNDERDGSLFRNAVNGAGHNGHYSLSIVETQRYGDAWDWWFRGLQSGLAQVNDENDPIILLDGHTSKIPIPLLMSVAKNVGQYQRVVFPVTYHLCPTHNWRSTYGKRTSTSKSYVNASKTPYDAIESKIPGYLQKRVINIAFTKKDGEQALKDIDPSSSSDDEINVDDRDDMPILGSAVSACGRLMLAEYFYEKQSLNVHRNYIASNDLELHGWNRLLAEKSAIQGAKLKLEQNKQDFTAARIKQEVLKKKQINLKTEKDEQLLAKGLKMLKNNSEIQKNLLESTKKLQLSAQTTLPLTMILPEVPFLGHKKCASAADAMSYCEGGPCAAEELAFLTTVGSEKNVDLLTCSAKTLMNPVDGLSDGIESISDVQTYFHPDVGYEYSAIINRESVRFSLGLLNPDMHQ